MKPTLFLLALAALATLASAQTPTERYAKAERQTIVKEAPNGFTSQGSHDYTDLPLRQGDFFRVIGSDNQDLPWGLNWRDLCDNSWTFEKDVNVHMDNGQTFHQINDYYTIDHNYVDPATGVNDPQNGDDIVSDGTTAWVRVCTSLVTNDIRYTITGGGGNGGEDL